MLLGPRPGAGQPLGRGAVEHPGRSLISGSRARRRVARFRAGRRSGGSSPGRRARTARCPRCSPSWAAAPVAPADAPARCASRKPAIFSVEAVVDRETGGGEDAVRDGGRIGDEIRIGDVSDPLGLGRTELADGGSWPAHPCQPYPARGRRHRSAGSRRRRARRSRGPWRRTRRRSGTDPDALMTKWASGKTRANAAMWDATCGALSTRKPSGWHRVASTGGV